MRRAGLLAGLSACLTAGLSPAVAAEPVELSRAQQIISDAKSEAKSIDAQAEALYRLAWERDDPEVSALAIDSLIRFGAHAMPVIHRHMSQVDQRHSADLAAVALLARSRFPAGALPPDYLPALDAALWHGSIEAKRLAIPQLAREGFEPSLLPAIDAAVEHPELTESVIRALIAFGDDRARFFLRDLLDSERAAIRRQAANAMAKIGNRTLDSLRSAVLAESSGTREAAVASLLPVTGLDDLATLNEYLAVHPDDDAALRERVLQRARQLEMILQIQQDQQSGSGG